MVPDPLGDYATWPQSLRSTLSLVLNAKGIAALYWGAEQRLLYNDAYGMALGDRHPWAFGRPMPEVLTDIAPVLGPQVAEVLRTGEGFAIENLAMVMHRHGRDEETVWTYSFSPVQGETGDYAGVLLLATEMTAQKQAERLARQAGMRLETALELAALGTFDWDAASGQVELNARSREIFSFASTEPIQASDIFARLAAEDLDRVRTASLAAVEPDAAFDAQNLDHRIDFNYDIVHPNGARRSIKSSGIVIEGYDGRRRMLGNFQDVTEAKWTETQWRAQKLALERQVEEKSTEQAQMWETSPDLMLVIDHEGMFRRVNPAWMTVLGYTSGELIGHHANEFVLPQDHVATVDAYLEAAAGRLPQIVNHYGHKDGSTRRISWNVSLVGDLTYATGRDVTMEHRRQAELELAQEALRQSQKMEAIGQLTGGVAHDFNNLLTVIRSSCHLLKRPDLPEDKRMRYVAAISETVDRAAKLTGQLLAFARRQALTPEVFAVCNSVRSLTDMMGTLIGSRMEIAIELPDVPCFVNADTTQFDTVLVNLMVNARDAMDSTGRITIKVQGVESIPSVHAQGGREGSFVAVSISDTGSGIEPDLLERIFEPFFTTKVLGKGTGLGLSQVFGFVKQSGGEVTVDSTLGEGTTFTLYLPRVSAPAQAAVVEAPEVLVDGHGIRVLVVEDNADVGAFAVQSLTDLGYTTVLAEDGLKALAELARGASRFDVVFSDVMMPGMTGIELGQEIRRLYHDLPVVLTSGYSHVLAQNGSYGFELLHKPYSVEQLSKLLAKAAKWQRRRRLVEP